MNGLKLRHTHPRLSREEAYLARNFSAGLEKTRPYLFDLADQLIEAWPERQWDAMFVDDNNGRLPARFLRQALAHHNIEVPARFINGGRHAREKTSYEEYVAYVEEVSKDLGDQRVLLVTEQTSHFHASGTIAQPLLARFREVDLASLNRATEDIEPPALFSATFFGSVGSAATTDVNLTFESIDILENIQGKKKRLIHRFLPLAIRAEAWQRKDIFVDHGTTYPLTNLDQRLIEEASPAARRARGTKYRRLAAHCFRQMNRLAAEYARVHETAASEAEPRPVVDLHSTKPLTGEA